MIIAIASILLLMLIAWAVLWGLNYWHVCEVDDDFAGMTQQMISLVLMG